MNNTISLIDRQRFTPALCHSTTARKALGCLVPHLALTECSTMNKHYSGVSRTYITLFLISLGLLSAGSASAQVSWTGAVDNNWSTAGNWSGGTPSGAAVIFNNTDKTGSTTVNSIVDADLTLSSLSFINSGSSSTADWQVVQIGAAQTLTLNGSGLTGGDVFFLGTETEAAGKSYTYAKMTGGGAFVINASDDDFLLTRVSSNDSGTARLDLSGLSSFTADVANFYVGQGRRTTSTLILASTGAGANAITASKLVVGDSNGSDPGGVNLLSLGTTNTLNVNDIFVGANAGASGDYQRASGAISFQNDGSSVTIRGADGTSRANLSIGLMDAASNIVTNNHLTGTVDFTGGTVDALLGAVKIGEAHAQSGSNGGATGTLSMDAGTIDATSVLLGLTKPRSQASLNPATGILNVAGGTFTAGSMSLAENLGSSLTDTGNAGGGAHGTLNVSGTGTVSVTGDITMGTRTGGSTDVVATVDIAGGTLTVGGNMTENAANVALAVVTSSVNLHGGTLDMTGGTIKVDTFTLDSGTLKNLGQFNSGDVIGAALVKTGAGTLNIEGVNTYTGATKVSAGVVSLGAANTVSSSSNVVLDGGTLQSAFSQTLGMLDLTASSTLDLSTGGTFVFADSSSLEGSWSGMLSISGTFVDGASVKFGIGGLTSNQLSQIDINGNAATLDGSGFLAIASAAIPEPSSYVMLAGLLALGMGFLRRTRCRSV